MVFVTTDPARDTPSVIQTWLSHFSSSFTGLTGTIAQIQSAETAIGMPLSFAEKSTSPGSSYEIVHAGYVLVYTQSRAHLEFPAEITVSEETHDLVFACARRMAVMKCEPCAAGIWRGRVRVWSIGVHEG